MVIKLYKNRKAVAMIELIFSIVVMGIVLLSIPMITAQSSRSEDSAIMQESVAAAASQMQLIMGKFWDESDTNTSLGSPILITDSHNFTTKAGLNSDGRTYRSTIGTELYATAPANFADGVENDMDDYNNFNTTVSIYRTENTTTSTGDYIDININMISTVDYIGDSIILAPTTTFNYNPTAANLGGATSNIKRISLTLTSAEPTFANKNIRLDAFSCNIGSAIPNTIGP
ncbi:MAG: hypothetical protein PHE73_07805 [Sulfurovaceae bacterium]|nr:hypothetical protein [Sulfurovaceae bacterium]